MCQPDKPCAKTTGAIFIGRASGISPVAAFNHIVGLGDGAYTTRRGKS